MAKERLSKADVEIVPIKDIIIGPRRREKLTGIAGLAKSIKRRGLIHPIVLNDDDTLVAGRRRLAAFVMLRRRTIPVRYAKMNEEMADGTELEENTFVVPYSIYEKSKARVQAIKAEKEEMARKGVRGATTPSARSAGKAAGMSSATAQEAGTIVALGDRFPFLRNWTRDQFRAVDKVVGHLDHKDDAALNSLFIMAGTENDPKTVMQMLDHLYDEYSTEIRKRIFKNALSADPVKQERAVTDACKVPPMPDVRIDPCTKARQLLTRAIQFKPNERWVTGPLKTAIASINEAIKMIDERQ